MRRWRLHEMSTSTLTVWARLLDELPLCLMSELRTGIKKELLARELGVLADDVGGHLVGDVRGRQ